MYMSYKDVKNNKKQVIEIIKTQLRNNSSYEDGAYWFHFFVAEDFDGDDEYGNNVESLVVVGEFSAYNSNGRYFGDRHSVVYAIELEYPDYTEEYAEILGVEYVPSGDWDDNAEIYYHLLELYENHPNFAERFQANCEAIYENLLRDLEEVS